MSLGAFNAEMPTHGVQAVVPVGKWIAQQGFKAALGGFNNRSTSKERPRRTRRDTEEDI